MQEFFTMLSQPITLAVGTIWLFIVLFLTSIGFLYIVLLRQRRRLTLISRKERQLRKQQQEREETVATEKKELLGLIETQKRALKETGDRLDRLRRQHHDYRQQLLILRELAQSGGNADALESRFPDMDLAAGGTSDMPSFCENTLVNSLVGHYLQDAEHGGVALDVIFRISDELWLDVRETGALFGNLLENIVTAALEAPEGMRKLRIRVSEGTDRLVITTGNTYGTPRIASGDIFLSTKPDHDGIGLSSIREVAEKYGGRAMFYVKNDMFYSSVILFRPQTAHKTEEVSREKKKMLPDSARLMEALDSVEKSTMHMEEDISVVKNGVENETTEHSAGNVQSEEEEDTGKTGANTEWRGKNRTRSR